MATEVPGLVVEKGFEQAAAATGLEMGLETAGTGTAGLGTVEETVEEMGMVALGLEARAEGWVAQCIQQQSSEVCNQQLLIDTNQQKN